MGLRHCTTKTFPAFAYSTHEDLENESTCQIVSNSFEVNSGSDHTCGHQMVQSTIVVALDLHFIQCVFICHIPLPADPLRPRTYLQVGETSWIHTVTLTFKFEFVVSEPGMFKGLRSTTSLMGLTVSFHLRRDIQELRNIFPQTPTEVLL